MPPATTQSKSSSISDVTDSAVVFRYKRFMKGAVFLIITTQIGVTISNDSVKTYLPIKDLHIIPYITMGPLVLGPLLAGYLLDKKFFRPVLFMTFLLTFIGQLIVTVSSLLKSPIPALTTAGRATFIVGYAMSAPCLARLLLMWLTPEIVPMGLAIYLAVEICSQSAGSILYNIVFTEMNHWLPQVIALGLCASSLFLACILGYVDNLANLRETRDSNLLIQQMPTNFQRMKQLPKVLWAILVSSSTTLACIYTFQYLNTNYIDAFSNMKRGGDTNLGVIPYTGAIIGGFSMLGLPFFAKTIKVERQKLKLFICEQVFAIAGFVILLFPLSWANYIPAIALLGVANAALYLTFFILFLSIIKWEFLGMIIGIFCSLRNFVSLILQNVQNGILKLLDDPSVKDQFRTLIVILVATTLFVGFLISLLVFIKQRTPPVVRPERGASEVTEPLMRGSRARRHSSVLSV